ncbi:FAD-dependent oxidoreductase [Thalassovivens spotae]
MAPCHGWVLQGQETDPRHYGRHRADLIGVVVIGAGMSGIASARALQAAGLPVLLIDKGAGISGQKGIKARSHCWQGHNVRSRCAIP